MSIIFIRLYSYCVLSTKLTHLFGFVCVLGEQIFNELKSKVDSCDFIFSGSKNQDMVARQWKNNNLKVLISTTIGLVGNESYNTQLVCIVGFLYDLPSIVQAIGRIRPNRRKKDTSSCVIFTPTNNNRQLHLQKQDNKSKFDMLVGAGVLSSKHKEKYMTSMTTDAVSNWLLKDVGCRFVSLANRLGFDQRKCGLCDACTETAICKLASLRNESARKSNEMKENGLQLLQRLKYKCIVCNKQECKGDCVVKSIRQNMVCYHCLGRHRSIQCNNYKELLKGKACYSCYCYNYSGSTSHSFTTCREKGQIMERLRCIIQSKYLSKSIMILIGVFSGK